MAVCLVDRDDGAGVVGVRLEVRQSGIVCRNRHRGETAASDLEFGDGGPANFLTGEKIGQS